LVAARNETRGTVLADHLEVAQSLIAKFWGLMGRPSLPPGHGLWLPGSNGIHMFFMRIPIDAVFLSRAWADGTRTVISIRPGLRPWAGIVPFVRGADGVLELSTGTAIRSSTQRGDVIRIGEPDSTT
jgi:uncharacterized membrane protein (UPF0127 family)